jgi:hypothetical protein
MKHPAGWIALLFAAVLGITLSTHDVAWAQDPRATIVQKNARDWLALTDRGDASASWNAAGKQFQNAITVARWAEGFKTVRPPLGAVVDRTMLSTEFTKSFPGAPDGDYALLAFRTNFAKKTDARETLTLEREADGNWRVIGYFIQ